MEREEMPRLKAFLHHDLTKEHSGGFALKEKFFSRSGRKTGVNCESGSYANVNDFN
jgi:hypothetical protein